jgi:Holliday junction DNA helicase RuvA
MIDYIKGEIIELTPTDMVVECYGIGYSILISVQTYSALEGKSNATVYIHHYLREDEELYYGFATKDERSMFRLLIGVSGIGAATARMMLSSLTVEEIQNAILSDDVNRIKSVKGIGLKSAQRMILELKDKVVKGEQTDMSALFTKENNKASEEATTALIMLGFTKANVTKAVNAVLKEDPTATVENLIRKSLQRLS